MKTENIELKPARLITPPNPDPSKISREMVEGYIAHGRHLKSLYLLDLFRRLGRWSKPALSRFTGSLGITFDHLHVSAKGIATHDKGDACRHRHC